MTKKKDYKSKLTTSDQQAILKIKKGDQTYELYSTAKTPGIVLCNVIINGERVAGFKNEPTGADLWDAVELILCVFNWDHRPTFLTPLEILEIAYGIATDQRQFA